MSNRTRILATYRISEDELIQCSLSIPSNYPDAVSEAKATVLAMMHEQIADVLAQTRAERPGLNGGE